MRTILLLASAALLAALGGCANSGGQNLNGFAVDQGCADYHAKSAIYGGNRALAYATDCSNGQL
jgi:hypothetical protein